jgi:ABC-2 type transport system permease protein
MKFWELFKRNLKETYRDLLALASLLAFPLLLLVIFRLVLYIVSTPDYNLDFVAPGIIVFGLLIMIPTASRLMARDKEKGYMSRLLATPTRPGEFILGYSLCMMLAAVVQIVFLFVCAMLLGMQVEGNVLLVLLILLLTAFAGTGIGMLAGALSKNGKQAALLVWVFAILLAVLSGIWFSISCLPEWAQVFANLFPFAHAVSAAREILTGGAGMAAVQGDVLFLTAWAAGAGALGIFFFYRTMRS